MPNFERTASFRLCLRAIAIEGNQLSEYCRKWKKLISYAHKEFFFRKNSLLKTRISLINTMETTPLNSMVKCDFLKFVMVAQARVMPNRNNWKVSRYGSGQTKIESERVCESHRQLRGSVVLVFNYYLSMRKLSTRWQQSRRVLMPFHKKG